MIEEEKVNNIEIPLRGEGWFQDLPKELSSYPNSIFYRYTLDNDLVKKKEVGYSMLLPNYGPIKNEGFSLNIFIRDDLEDEKKRIVFLHELYEAYYIEVEGSDKTMAHKKAEAKYSFRE